MNAADTNIQNNEPPTKRSKLVESSQKTQPIFGESLNSEEAMETNGAASMLANGAGVHEETGNSGQLDTNLYSRQIYTLGESAMLHLRRASVLVSGMGGVGVELAKNLILGGVHKVLVQDTKSVTWFDLSSQYYMSESDLGRNRASVCFADLEELNDTVVVSKSLEPITEQMIAQVDLIVLTDTLLSDQLKINEWTRKLGRGMIVADCRGLFGQIFVDLGDEFVVNDPNGEPCSEVFVDCVEKSTGDVYTHENANHGLEDGDVVTFTDVVGMEDFMGTQVKVTVKTASKFNIGSVLSERGPEIVEIGQGGRANQVKVPNTVHFLPLHSSLRDPSLVVSDFAKFTRPSQLHTLWTTLHEYIATFGHSPTPRCDSDADRFIALLPSDPSIDLQLARTFSYQAMGNLCPLTSFVGGVAAQEVIKAITHHMSPLNQYLYFDALEALPGHFSPFDQAKLTQDMCKPMNCRYDGQAAVFGWPFQRALGRQNWFIVGAGAIGCELLKNAAMMGVAVEKEARFRITDMDHIETSNLNRQFLFRKHDIGKKKSEVAVRVTRRFNEQMNISALSERVGVDTEHIFNDEFFEGLNGVANALDNVDARQYMDRRCVYYRLPLIESGTMGAKGNIQVVFPNLTESYGSSSDPPERSIPICTLKNFPYEIQHTIQWARDMFEGLFSTPAETINQFVDDQRLFFERVEKMHMGQKLDLLETVKRALIETKPTSNTDCVHWARTLWQEHFHNTIAQLLHAFPPDHTSTQGAKFWSGTKRCPRALQFDVEQPYHLDFVHSASILRAQQYGLSPIFDRAKVASICASMTVPKFRLVEGVRIAVTTEDVEEMTNQSNLGEDESEDRIQIATLALAKLKPSEMKALVPIDFEKDDDSNYHVQFVTATSNLRADNYGIEQADNMKTKQIAGRIIPAIATTTSAVAGLASLELYKMVTDKGLPRTPLDRFKNGFLNLAISFFGFSEPIAAPKMKYNDKEFTLWDRIDCHGPMTLKQMINWLSEEHGLTTTMLSSGVSLLFSFFMSAGKKEERLKMDMKTLVETVSGKKVPFHVNVLVFEVMADDRNGEDVETPYIKYSLSPQAS